MWIEEIFENDDAVCFPCPSFSQGENQKWPLIVPFTNWEWKRRFQISLA